MTAGHGVAWCRVDGDAVVVELLVVPGSSRDRVVGLHGDTLRLQVAAPPEAGRANRAVVALLAAWAGVAPAAVEITRGSRGRRKSARLAAPQPEELLGRLHTLVGDA